MNELTLVAGPVIGLLILQTQCPPWHTSVSKVFFNKRIPFRLIHYISGLLVVRACLLTVCGRAKIMLICGFLSGLVLRIFQAVVFSGCLADVETTTFHNLILIIGIINCFTNFVIFGSCAWKIWCMHKLKAWSAELGCIVAVSLLYFLYKLYLHHSF